MACNSVITTVVNTATSSHYNLKRQQQFMTLKADLAEL